MKIIAWLKRMFFEKEEDVDLNALLTDMKKTDEELEQVMCCLSLWTKKLKKRP